MKYISIITKSSDETLELGVRIAKNLSKGSVVALFGDLGAGKTVISRGIARGLQIDDPVTSPTFTVVQEYPLSAGGYLFHLDMYRINSEEDAYAFGIEDFIFNDEAITIIEWAERIPELLQYEYENSDNQLFTITMEHQDEECRKIVLPKILLENGV